MHDIVLLDRTLAPGPCLRTSPLEERDASPGTPIMFGHFAVFDRWTEINSIWEGNFLERVARGAFRKTFRENRAGIRALFQHGMDPEVGDKPLGPVDDLREDTEGAYYEVPLLDAPYVRQSVLPGLEAGLYGASFRFQVMRENIVETPEASDYNPRGLPERTITEARTFEFGPVTFPAYVDASAGVRSLGDPYVISTTDEVILARFATSPRFAQLIDAQRRGSTPPPPAAGPSPTADEDESHDDLPDDAGASPHLVSVLAGPRRTFRSRDEFIDFLAR